MKKFILLCLISLVLYSEQDYSLRDRLGNFNIENHLQGELRVGFIQNDDYDFLGVGGHIHLHSPQYYGLSLNGSLYAFYNFEREQRIRRQKDIFWAEANVGYRIGYFDMAVGRFMVDTPYADSDDIRIVPNYFQGVKALYCDGAVGMEFIYLSKMAGWESGEDIGRFKSLAQVVGVEGIGSLYGLRLALFDDFVWFYRLEDGGDLIYLDLDYEQFGSLIAFQGSYAHSSGKELMGEFESTLIGALISKKFGRVNCFGAFNRVFNGSAMPAFGGGPYFTSMEELTIDMAGDEAQSFVLGVEGKKDHIVLGVMGGKFYAPSFDQKELDIYLRAKIYRANLESVYARVVDRYGRESKTIFRVILKYGF